MFYLLYRECMWKGGQVRRQNLKLVVCIGEFLTCLFLLYSQLLGVTTQSTSSRSSSLSRASHHGDTKPRDDTTTISTISGSKDTKKSSLYRNGRTENLTLPIYLPPMTRFDDFVCLCLDRCLFRCCCLFVCCCCCCCCCCWCWWWWSVCVCVCVCLRACVTYFKR